MTQDVAVDNIPTWTLADRLRKAREHRGLHQQELADEIGVSRNSISNYESGRTAPRRIVLMAWAMRTGVSLEWLETGTVPSSDHRGPGGEPGRPGGAPTTSYVHRPRRTRVVPLQGARREQHRRTLEPSAA